ncbi:MAG TPA: TolC family protein, partial [Bacteroidales bacterium]|nr:TolC family protein [Bacteroidales bacterium]
MKYMKRKILKLAILSLSFAFVNVNLLGQESVLKLDLETALKIAHDNNPTIKIADIEIQRVDYAKKEAIGALLPNLNAV